MHSGCFSLHGVGVDGEDGVCCAVLTSPLYLSAVPTCKESDVMMTPSDFGAATVLNDSSLYPATPSSPPWMNTVSLLFLLFRTFWVCYGIVCVFTPH